MVVIGRPRARALPAKLWQWRFCPRSLHVFAINRLCNPRRSGAAATALLQRMECTGSAVVRSTNLV